MKIETQIEFHKIKEIWSSLAITDQAKQQIMQTTICLEEQRLKKQLKDTTDGRELIEKLGTPPLQNETELKDIFQAARQGSCLTPYQLERVEKFLVLARRLRDYLNRGKAFDNPLAYYEENLDTNEELREEIARQIRGGEVDDYASKELAQLRSQIQKQSEKMKQKAEQLLRTYKSCMADQFCTMRSGRICLPVKKEYKLKVPGSVIDRSGTGNTLFIEPAACAGCYDELQLLKIQEEQEVSCILYTLTAAVEAAAPAMEQSIAMMEKLDFIFSKAKLSLDMQAVEPVVNTSRRLLLRDARHPLMKLETAVPLQLELPDGVRGIVITGPNTGGKTVAIKTVMLNCMMAQCGLHVTCRQADLCMNSSYLCDIGDGQNLAENLSTFSAHIKNVLEILSEVSADSLVILDELGSGTDPAEGMGIAVAVLEELQKSGAVFLVTTHYPEIKDYAEQTPGIVNARMTFDKETLNPTYQMVIGEAGESCAFYIADRLGMPESMLKTAVRAAYGEEMPKKYQFQTKQTHLPQKTVPKLSKSRPRQSNLELTGKYRRGDSVMLYPDRKIGIVCEPVNEKGVLRVQLPSKKIWINHKRVKLHVAAEKLYPEDYDFSIIFETAQNRKIQHDMGRKYTKEVLQHEE